MNSEEAEKAGMDPMATFEVDHSSGVPAWIQVKNRLSYLLGVGEYAPGDKLPTVRALAVDLGISYNTVNRAYMDLEREGYITTRRGRGTFVNEHRSVGAATDSDGPIDLLADELIRACTDAGMTGEDVMAFLEDRLYRRRMLR